MVKINGEVTIPPYTPKPGGIGEKIASWFLNLPIVGDILLSIFARDKWLEKITTSADEGTLKYYATYGDAHVKQACLKALQERFPDSSRQASAIGNWLSEAAKNPSQKIGETIHSAFNNPTLIELTETLGAGVYDSIMSMAIGGGEKLSPDLQERIRRFLGTTILLSSAPKIAGSIAEITTLGQIDTLGDIFRDAYFNLGLGFVTWQMTSPLIDAGIGQFLRKQSNYIFRPTDFSWSQLKDLYALGEIDYNRLRQRLAELGYKDEDIDAIVKLAFKPLSEGIVLGLWDSNLIDDAECARRLRAIGYNANDIALIMSYEREQKAKSQKDTLLSTAKKAFREGLIGEARLREILSGLNYTPEAIDLEIAVANLEKAESERTLTTSQLKEAYINNVITDTEVRNGLLELGLRTDEIAILIETWNKSKAPKVLRLNKQTILQAWARGVLTDSETRTKLAEIGYPTSDIDIIMRTAYAEGLQTRPKAGVTYLIEAARSNVISIAQLEDELRTRGYSQFDVDVICGIAAQKREIGLSVDAVLDAYKADVLDRVTAGTKLIDLGLSPGTATMRLDTADAEKQLAKPKLSLAILMSLTVNKLITFDQLHALLKDRGYSDTDIELILTAVSYTPPTPLSRDIVIRAYKQGVLNRDDVLSRLLTLGYTVEDSNVIITTAEKEMTTVQARPTVTTYVAAAREGILSIEELTQKLILYGLAEDDVKMFVELATYKPAEPAKKLTKSEILDAYKAFMFNRVDALRRLEMLGYAIEDADILLRMARREPQDSEVHTLYRAGILSTEQAATAFYALGYTEEQIEYYFEHYGIEK